MIKQNGATGTAASAIPFLATAGRLRQGLRPMTLLLVGLASAAQEPQVHITPAVPKPAQITLASLHDQAQEPSPAAKTMLTVPAGTRLSVAPVRWISLKHTRPGDNVNLQITFPVTNGNQMLIPPGTYIQGIVDKITRRDKHKYLLNVRMRSADIIFATGYTVTIPGSVFAEPVVAQLTLPASPSGQSVPTLVAAGGSNIPVMTATGSSTPPGLPPLPSLGNGPRNAIIGVGIAAAVGTGVVVALAVHRSDVVMEVGMPMEITLPSPLFLEEDRVLAAVQRFGVATVNAPPQIVQPPQRICWTPDTPATSDTVIPATPDIVIPGTPDTVIPGDPPTIIPGTPEHVIPGSPERVIFQGSPGTRGTPYPCPR
jgi:hypothetical protein